MRIVMAIPPLLLMCSTAFGYMYTFRTGFMYTVRIHTETIYMLCEPLIKEFEEKEGTIRTEILDVTMDSEQIIRTKMLSSNLRNGSRGIDFKLDFAISKGKCSLIHSEKWTDENRSN